MLTLPGRISCLVVSVVAPPIASASTSTAPGDIIVQEPTFTCTGIEWRIEGDDDGDCAVRVDYRRAGDAEWLPAQPLFRVENIDYGNRSNDRLYKEALVGQPFGNKLAGSIFNLVEDSEYEVRLSLADPDGGEAQHVIAMRTRATPRAAEDGRILHVVPGDGGGAGTEVDPLRGIAAANVVAEPGDIILLHEGIYPPLAPARDGKPGRPIVWRGVDDGKVLIEGTGPTSVEDSQEAAIDLRRRAFVHLENVTVQNSAWGVRMDLARDCVVRRCSIRECDIGIGAWSEASRGKRWLISDNTIVGRKQWSMGIERGASKSVLGLRAIVATGDGHVVRHNRIEGFNDGITLGNMDIANGIPDYAPNTSIDIHHNEIVTCLDTALELDWARSNVRCFDNRATNARNGVSASPAFGGPLYIIRNALINNLYAARFQNEPSGVVLLHNTGLSLAGIQPNGHNFLTRNNVFAATRPTVMHGFPVRHIDFDFNGYLRGDESGRFFIGIEPYGYKTLRDYAINMDQEANSRELQLSDLELAGFCDLSFQEPGAADARPAADGATIDAGTPIANINDGYAGAAPDLGCYEHGQPIPRYGPRE